MRADGSGRNVAVFTSGGSISVAVQAHPEPLQRRYHARGGADRKYVGEQV